MVEDIKELSPELEADSFSNHSSFKHGEIEIIDSGSPQVGIHSRLTAETPSWRRSPARGVEIKRRVSCDAAADGSTAILVTTGYIVRTYVGNAQAGAFQRGRTSITDFEREALLEGGYAIDSPP